MREASYDDDGVPELEHIIEMIESGKLSVEVGRERLEALISIQYLLEIDLDHVALDFWTIEMVISWIKWKDIRQVLRHCELCYQDRSVWEIVSCIGDENHPLGHVLRGYTKPEFSSAYVSPSGETINLSLLTDTIDEFRNKISVSRSVAEGLLFLGNEHAEIRPELWKHLDFRTLDGETIVFAGKTPTFRNVKFPKNDILSIWKLVEPAPEKIVGKHMLCTQEDLDKMEVSNSIRKYAKALIVAYPDGVNVEHSEKEKVKNVEVAYQKIYGTNISGQTPHYKRTKIRDALRIIKLPSPELEKSPVVDNIAEDVAEEILAQANLGDRLTWEEVKETKEMRADAVRRSFGIG